MKRGESREGELWGGDLRLTRLVRILGRILAIIAMRNGGWLLWVVLLRWVLLIWLRLDRWLVTSIRLWGVWLDRCGIWLRGVGLAWSNCVARINWLDDRNEDWSNNGNNRGIIVLGIAITTPEEEHALAIAVTWDTRNTNNKENNTEKNGK